MTNVNGLLHGNDNFNSVWGTVSSVEKLLKTELGYSSFNIRKLFIILVIIGLGFLTTSIYVKRKQGN